jgi:SAM-dependent methyltransferase
MSAACRICGTDSLVSVLDFGSVPLANALRDEAGLLREEKKYPLHLFRCTTCSLLQISETVPAETLFRHYMYHSSFSDAFLQHCKHLAEETIASYQLTKDSLVIDIASNDGYLLQYYKEHNIRILGIEPATNIVTVARKKGIETLNEFFTADVAASLKKDGCQADIIHAHNVLPHVQNQRDFMQGVSTLLKPQGVAILEFAYAIDTINKTEFDQVYHEHMCYFSLTAFQVLAELEGLEIIDVHTLSIHGGSLRVTVAYKGAHVAHGAVAELLANETAWGVREARPYDQFRVRALALREELTSLLRRLKSQGKSIAAYGASAKGSTLLGFCSIGSDTLDFIVDRSTVKQGYFAPGTHLEIFPVEKLLSRQPDYTLLLTWNFAEEILEQQKEYRARDGKFIVPVPEVQII